jgi:hypothetical protein
MTSNGRHTTKVTKNDILFFFPDLIPTIVDHQSQTHITEEINDVIWHIIEDLFGTSESSKV